MFFQILRQFLQLLSEAVPLFLVGTVLGAALEAWLKPEWVTRWVGRGHRSVGMAIAAGALLPGCAMSTVPLAHSLKARGAAPGTVTTFLMIAPILSPHTIILTATLISVPMAVGRVILAIVISWALGAVLNAISTPAETPIGRDDIHPTTDGELLSCCAPENPAPKWRGFLSRLGNSMRNLLPFLFGGLALAAVITTLVPEQTIREYLGGGWTGYLAAVLIGIPIYVCDGGEIPLTRALLESGVGVGPAFCFMLTSVGTCFPTIAMAAHIIGARATSLYLLAWIVLAVGGGLVMSALT